MDMSPYLTLIRLRLACMRMRAIHLPFDSTIVCTRSIVPKAQRHLVTSSLWLRFYKQISGEFNGKMRIVS